MLCSKVWMLRITMWARTSSINSNYGICRSCRSLWIMPRMPVWSWPIRRTRRCHRLDSCPDSLPTSSNSPALSMCTIQTTASSSTTSKRSRTPSRTSVKIRNSFSNVNTHRRQKMSSNQKQTSESIRSTSIFIKCSRRIMPWGHQSPSSRSKM